jgi:hypothetical protein
MPGGGGVRNDGGRVAAAGPVAASPGPGTAWRAKWRSSEQRRPDGAAAWVAARPLVLAPIARLFGTVKGR